MIVRPCRTCGTAFRPVGKSRYCSTACRCGTDAGYNAGCTCDRCRAAHAKVRNLSRMGNRAAVPAVGTVRRIQALACLGWSASDLSRRLGRDRTYLAKTVTRDTVERPTAAAVAKLYDELSMTWCTTATAPRTAADARSRGWAPPLAWDERAIDDPDAAPAGHTAPSPDGCDAVVVDRILSGEHHLPATRAERIEVARRWVESGRSLASLGRATGWKPERYFRTSDQATAA